MHLIVRCLPQSIILIQIVKKWKEGGPRMEKKMEYLVIFTLILVILDEVINSIRRK